MRLRSPSFLPPTAVLELTYMCNHHCIFCSCPWEADRGFEKMEEMSTEQWQSVLEDLCELGVSSFAFTGGEALLREDCIALLDFASKLTALKTETVNGKLVQERKTPELYLLTNGSTLTDEILDFLAAKDIKLSISLPGLYTFEKHTGFDHADNVLQWFGKAKERDISTTVNSTVTALNINELPKTLSAAFLAGAGQLLMNRFLPGGRGLLYEDELVLNLEQVRGMLSTADDILVRANRTGHLGTEIPLCLLDGLELKKLQVGTRCSAARGFFVVGPSGYVRVCNHSEHRLNHITDWKNLKTNPYWKTFSMKKYLPASCRSCSRMTDCDGGCREAANVKLGSVDSPDPLLT
ncbi:MAG: radical SAM protein [Candidatus Aegiribacteria sp.]|nr:radical SAM protein [Candidatus Aegiribacteria sp.]